MPVDALHSFYDALVQYASHHRHGMGLKEGRQEFIRRTGDLFESDDAFERRISAFLEWYTLDCSMGENSGGKTLVQHYSQQAPLDDSAAQAAQAWQLAAPSLFTLVKVTPQALILDDLLLSQRHSVAPTSAAVGLNPKDIIAGRVVIFEGVAHLTDGVSYFPKASAKVLGRVTKKYRKGQVPGVSRLDLLHRLIFLANRCDRYRHVEPQRIFAEGEAQLFMPTQQT